jgi:transcriptional regulator with GAF, ATPase, and Fis domain
VFHLVDQVAPTNATVLLLGETGTGKELIARAIHDSSPRREHPLIKVNCAALPDTLIESELFGHEKGAFTGAAGRRKGRFELADEGTIFLDEIGDLPPELQAKLLRVLQSGEFERLGSEKTLTANVRVIAATNRNLEAAAADGSFRADLYYRLKVFPIEVPPLRDRRKDIPLLVWHFITMRQATLGRRIETVPQRTMERLVAYDWPGNVRELEHVIERALILSPGSTLMVEDLVSVLGAAAPLHAGGSQQMADAERAHILRVLRDCGWKVKGSGNAAERLGLNPSTLRSRMKKLGIARPAIG